MKYFASILILVLGASFLMHQVNGQDPKTEAPTTPPPTTPPPTTPPPTTPPPTTAPPTTPPPTPPTTAPTTPTTPAPFVCKESGKFGDATDCAVYYQCVKVGSVFYKYTFTCQNSVFCESQKACVAGKTCPC